VRDVHPSGVKPFKANRTPQLLNAQGLVTCESCHSLHQGTGVERFVLYPFKNGDLCNRCH
jgi:predicted CXXCH cytochrome family protein